MNKILQTLSEELRIEAYNILSYWEKNTQDFQNGGFYGRIDGNDQLHADADKGAVLNARILWTFSSAHRIFGNESYLEMAHRAKDYFVTHFIDNEQGGVYWSVDYQGNPKDTKKQIYALSFAIYAFSEYYKITQDETILAKAKELFQLIEKHSFDNKQNGYFEAYSRDWKLLEDLRLSEKDANEKKTMNTHLHVLEAYTNLFRVWKDETLKAKLENAILVFLDKIIDSNAASFNLFFNENWVSQHNLTSFGHDVEGSWLLLEAAEVLGNEELIERVKLMAHRMADAVRNKAMDIDGAIVYEGENGEICDFDKEWWQQAEAMIGFVNAWQHSNDESFLDDAIRVWEFTKKYMIDHQNGEWFYRLTREREPIRTEDKVGMWKCPYHTSRMCFEIIERAKLIK